VARVRAQPAEQHADGRGLARAVGPEQPVHLSALEGQARRTSTCTIPRSTVAPHRRTPVCGREELVTRGDACGADARRPVDARLWGAADLLVTMRRVRMRGHSDSARGATDM